MSYLSECPVCGESEFFPYLTCSDHTVSHETFNLEQCRNCGFVLTNPQPDRDKLGRYYQSDSYISHSDKTSGIIDRLYKISRHFTLKWKLQLVNQHAAIKPQSILDYGCGTGMFLEYCKSKNLQIAGVEPSELARSHAEKNTRQEIYADVKEIGNRFDAITLWHVLEHIADLHETIDALKTRLEQNGTMFIAVPNHKSLDAKKYQEHWAAYDVPRHLWHFSKDTMQKLMDKHQLKLIHVIPMRLDSYYVSLLSEKYVGNRGALSNIARAVAQGWKSNYAARQTSEYSSLIYLVRK